MLVYFKVENYKSIKDPVVINFEATAIAAHQQTNVLEKGKTKLLKSVLLYGANASGKSKIMDAFVVYRGLILKSTSNHSTTILPLQPFWLNTETAKQPSHFEAEFILENKRYKYGFKANSKHIVSEWLIEVKATADAPVFLRVGQAFEVNERKFKNAKGVDKKCNENVLFLSVADQWNVALAKEIYRWFHDMVTINGLNDNSYRNFTNELLEDPVYHKQINELIAHADLGIKSVQYIPYTDAQRQILQEVKNDADLSNKGRVYAFHDVYDQEGNVAGLESFDMLMMESEGTKKFYNVIGAILDSIKGGNLVIIDELDARFHTLLTKAIISLFNSGHVKSGAQLLAVSHDVSVVDQELIRRDQVYIVEKDNFGATNTVSLAEYKSVRNETPFAKNYLEGKYGGIPFIENLETFVMDGKE